MANLNAIRKYLGFKVAQDSAPWEESKHHRSDDGKFTSGSGRGKTKEEDPKDGDGGDKNVKREEMSEEKATKIVREAFKVAKKELKGLKLVDHSLEADTDVADEDACKAINEFLTKKGLKAKVSGESKFKIAEDGYDDIQVMDDPMLEVLIDLCKIEMASKDLHYRAKGKPFYGIHELADLVKEIADSSDELNEVYYMGEKQMDPPERAFVAAKAAQLVVRGGDENALIKILVQFCDETVQAVENAKKQGVASGTAAVLDEISKKALQAKGLLERTAKEMPEQKPVDPNAIDKVIGKGLVIENGAEPAQDSGTHEGAIKAAQTRKSRGMNSAPDFRSVLQGKAPGKMKVENGSLHIIPNSPLTPGQEDELHKQLGYHNHFITGFGGNGTIHLSPKSESAKAFIKNITSATDSGTHEGAIKAAQTRKAHGIGYAGLGAKIGNRKVSLSTFRPGVG